MKAVNKQDKAEIGRHFNKNTYSLTRQRKWKHNQYYEVAKR